MPLHTFGSFSKGSSSKVDLKSNDAIPQLLTSEQKPVTNNFKGVGRRLDSNTPGEV